MNIQRTFQIDDLTPEELAQIFLDWTGDKQAQFFNAFKAITDTWRGAGWCQQCCEMSMFLDHGAVETINKLNEWANDPYAPPASLSPDRGNGE